MKKKNHSLEELLRAAREETPVVSFTETSEQIERLEASAQRKKRIIPAWLWERAFAFPLAVKHRFHELTDGFSENIATIFYNPVLTRLVNGTAFLFVLFVVFPALIHDTQFASLSQRIASEVSPAQAMEKFADNPRFGTANSVRRSYHANNFNITSKTAQHLAPETIAATTDTSTNTNTSVHTTIVANSTSEVAQNLAPSESQNSVLVRSSEAVSSNTFLTKSTSDKNTTNNIIPEAAQELTFWQRISVEARVATRTEFQSSQAQSLQTQDAKAFAARQQFSSEAASPLQNIALGVMYKLDEHHSIGVEGGTEPFLSSIRVNSFAGIGGTEGMTNPSQRNDSVRISLVVPDKPTITGGGNQPSASDITSTTKNRVWFGAAYQYTLPIVEVLGGIQPLARLTLGGGEIGVVSRAIVGARFLPQNQVSVLLAGEGAGIARQNETLPNNAWEFLPRLGMTLGLSVKF